MNEGVGARSSAEGPIHVRKLSSGGPLTARRGSVVQWYSGAVEQWCSGLLLCSGAVVQCPAAKQELCSGDHNPP